MLSEREVSSLYVVIFGRLSEGEGNRFWQNHGTSIAETADWMLATDEAKNYLGDKLYNNHEFIEFIYKNTFGKTYQEDPEGVNFWVNALESGKYRTKGEMIEDMFYAAIQPINSGPAQKQFLNRTYFSGFYADNVEYFNGDYQRPHYLMNSISDNEKSLMVATIKVIENLDPQGYLFFENGGKIGSYFGKVYLIQGDSKTIPYEGDIFFHINSEGEVFSIESRDPDSGNFVTMDLPSEHYFKYSGGDIYIIQKQLGGEDYAISSIYDSIGNLIFNDNPGMKTDDSESNNDDSGTETDDSESNNDNLGMKIDNSESNNNDSGTETDDSESNDDEDSSVIIKQFKDVDIFHYLENDSINYDLEEDVDLSLTGLVQIYDYVF